MAYPAHFRKKLLSVMEKEGLTIAEGAKRFAVGKVSVSRWKNNPDPVFKRNRPAQKIDMEALKKMSPKTLIVSFMNVRSVFQSVHQECDMP